MRKLEYRLQGFRYIKQAITDVRVSINNQASKHRTPAQLVKIVKEQGIFELIYGQRTHFELLKKSTALMKLLFSEKAIGEHEVNMIWDVCIKQGQQHKLEVYQVILEVCQHYNSNLSESVKIQFINKIEKIDPLNIIEKDIILLHELGKRYSITYRAPEVNQVRATAIMWDIATRVKPYPLEVIKQARKFFSDLASNWEDSLKEIYIAKAVDNISDGKLPLQNLKILSKLLESFMDTSVYVNSQRKGKQEFTEDLLKTQDLIDLLIEDLQKYSQIANDSYNKGLLTLENSNSLQVSENHCFTHTKNIKSRLNRIYNLLDFAKM